MYDSSSSLIKVDKVKVVLTEASSINSSSSPSSPSSNTSIQEQVLLHPHDVIIGWGNFSHNGNEWYRKLIENNRTSTESMKPVIAKVIIQALHQRVPHGRFLKLSLPSKRWTVVSNEEAIDKTIRALHDPSSQEASSSTRYNKRLVRDDDGGDDRDATDKNTLHLPKKRCVRDVTSSLKETEFRDSENNDQTAESFSNTANAASSYTALYTASSAMTRAKERSCALSNVSISKRYPKRQGDKTNYTFEERLAQLADYKQKNNGDTNVPFEFKGYGNLGSWVSHQRQQYKLHKQNKSSSKMKERFCALEKLGFDFEWKLNHTFNERLAQLADYKEKTGDCNVPSSFKGHNNLGIWVYNQRQQYKLHKQNKSSSKMKERFCALEKLDFNFEWRLNHAFKERLAQLADYKGKTGDCNVPFHFKEHKNLGRWVARERQQYKLYKENKPNSMTKERICELEKINFGCRKTTNSRPWLSLLAQKENDDNKVVLVNPSFPTLVVPPAETVRSNNDIDEKDDVGNIYRTEEDTRDDNSEKDSGSGGWRDLSDDYYGSDDDNCLVF